MAQSHAEINCIPQKLQIAQMKFINKCRKLFNLWTFKTGDIHLSECSKMTFSKITPYMRTLPGAWFVDDKYCTP